MDWPMPFGGIRWSIEFDERLEAIRFLAYVGAGCGEMHGHNIAVEFGREPARVFGSELLVQCYERWRASEGDRRANRREGTDVRSEGIRTDT